MLIFIGVTSRRSSQFYFVQVVRFLKLLWISLSAKYTSVWCHCMSIIRIHLKISEQLSKSEISYPERILIGIRDFREKSEGPRRDQDD